MLVRFGERRLVLAGERIERRAFAGEIDQQDVGEVPNHPLDGRIERMAIEQRQVQQQARFAAPAREHRAEASRECHRRGDAARARLRLERLPVGRAEFGAAAAEAHRRDPLGLLRERQARRGGQFGQLRVPVALCRIARGRAVVPQVGDVAAEVVGNADVRQRVAADERGQLIEHQREARRVEHEQVDIDVQAMPIAGKPRQLEVERFAALDVEHAMAEAVAQRGERLLALGLAAGAQIVHGDTRPARPRAPRLAAIRAERDAQHRMAGDERADGVLQRVRCQPGAVELLVQVAADAPERLLWRAADQIRVLDGRQVERLAVAHRRPCPRRDRAHGGACGAAPHQLEPAGERRFAVQLAHRQRVAARAQPVQARHQAHRVEAQLQQIGIGAQLLGTDAEIGGERCAQRFAVARNRVIPGGGRGGGARMKRRHG